MLKKAIKLVKKKEKVEKSEIKEEFQEIKIDFSAIEKKWQNAWADKKIFEVKEDSKKKKFYVIEMYPYPSAKGLHIGHAFNFVIGDIKARTKIMQGFNVLHPMGFDSFGLPAENAAIKAKSHPKIFTEKAIANFIVQQKALGLTYDWSRMVESHKPDYYRWDQWIFLKMFEKGLAYKKISPVNWCSKCNTVLANEQVNDGKCWRHTDTKVEIKQLNQWFLKITDYAEELYDKIDSLTEWPERIRAMQKNWIGKSYGTRVDFEIEDKNISKVIIIHGSNSSEKSANEGLPENERHWKPWIKKELEKRNIKVSNELYPKDWEPDYKEWKKVFEKNKIDENTILVGHSAGGGFLVRWLAETKNKVKKVILISPGKAGMARTVGRANLYGNEKIQDIGKFVTDGIVIYTSDNDIPSHVIGAREYELELPAKIVEMKNYGHFTKGSMGTEEFPELLAEVLYKPWPIFTTRVDTIYGVTFMVISAQHPKLWEIVTKEQKKEVEKFVDKIKSTSEKDLEGLEKEGAFTGSYAINPLTKEKIPVYTGNFVLAEYGSGMVMAVPTHDQRDFEFAKRYNIPMKIVIQPEQGQQIDIKTMQQAYVFDGKLVNSQEFNGMKNREAIGKITELLEKKKIGKKTTQFKLRDWLVSRQRFWGTPIPIIYCEKCGAVPVPEKDLPVKLPEDIKFTSERNPLIDNDKFVNVKCPKCGGKAKRETDTMDTFVNSSWYFLRYCDSNNNKEIFDKKKVAYWNPVDVYIGGAEHACMHLIYSRFYVKFLRDLGLLKFDEPAKLLFNQGMVHGEDGAVMSKSKGNGVDPLDVAKKYSADTLRIFLVSVASPDKDSAWSSTGTEGMHKFVNKFFSFILEIKKGKSSERAESKINKAIKEITKDLEEIQYNLAIMKIRGLINAISEEKELAKKDIESILKLTSPFCPHITEELWEKIGNKPFISLSEWPICDDKKINEELEKQEQQINQTIEDIKNILRIMREKQNKGAEKVYLYLIPKELPVYQQNKIMIEKALGLKTEIFAVNDSKKYDPQNKAQKTKPGKPAIYLE